MGTSHGKHAASGTATSESRPVSDGRSSRNNNAFLPQPHVLPQTMDSINWKQYLDDVANLDILEALEEQIDKFKDAVQAAVAKLCEPLQVMPS